MARHFADWLDAFMEYASIGEAPKHMYFWTGVSTLAGALRRKVWLDMGHFRWHPNFYIILVAPPGIVSKTTTADIGMKLLKQVPGIKFGPDVVTMQALMTAFAEVTEAYESPSGVFTPMSALTLSSGEFGNLLDPRDKMMVDLLVALWDGREGAMEKKTKHSGNDSIVNPWINLIGCTTPSWIAGNFPEYMIGGGFTSRCVFVYADEKAKYVAYPDEKKPDDFDATAGKLLDDLCHIAMNHCGGYKLSTAARAWGKVWYEKLYKERPVNLDDERFGGYIARKQTHLHKLAMVLATSSSDDLILTDEHLSIADTMLTDLEPDMALVFSKIGKSEASVYVDRLVEYVRRRGGAPYMEVYRFVHSYFPSQRDFEDMMAGCIRAGFVRLEQHGQVMMVLPLAII